MDVHIGREAVTSWRDFFVRYLLIVLGILSAWAVNQWNDWRQARHIAAQTRVALHAELDSDLKDVRESLLFNADAIASQRTFRHKLVDALVAHRPESEIDKEIVTPWDRSFRDKYPSLRRDAWDAAVAGQAATHLDADELRRYSAAYASMRDLQTFGALGLSSAAADLRRRFADWALNRRMGRTDATELARLLLLWESVEVNNEALLRGVDEAVSDALRVPALPATAASSPPPAASQ